MAETSWSVTPAEDGAARAGADGGRRGSPGHASAWRSGQPWTDAEYEQILAAAREGVTDIEDVAARIGRGRHPTLAKARRLLPVKERAAPVDRVLSLLRGHQEEPDYDWRRTTLEEPPPRPVIHPPARTGLPGLEGGDLVAVAYAVGLAACAVDAGVLARVGEEVNRRNLSHDLVEYRAERLIRQPGAEVTWAQVIPEAYSWVRRTFPPTASPTWQREDADSWSGPDSWT